MRITAKFLGCLFSFHLWGDEQLSDDHKTVYQECSWCHCRKQKYSEFWLQHYPWDAPKRWMTNA